MHGVAPPSETTYNILRVDSARSSMWFLTITNYFLTYIFLVKGPFHMLVLWSGTNFHMTSGVHSQKPHSSKPSNPICLARTTSLTVFVLFATPVAGWVSRLGYIFHAPSPPPFFAVFDQCCWLLYCCWLPSSALLSSLLSSCCTQCYCEALRAQTRCGALEVLFIIIIIIII